MKAHKLMFLIIVLFSSLNGFAQSIEEYKMMNSDTIFYNDNNFQVVTHNSFMLKSILKFDENKKIIVFSEDSTYSTTSYDTMTSNFKIIEISTHPLTYKKISKKIIKFNSYFYLMKEISTNKYFYLILFDYKDETNPILQIGKTYNLTIKSVLHEDFSFYISSLFINLIINNYLVMNMPLSNMTLNTLIEYNYSKE